MAYFDPKHDAFTLVLTGEFTNKVNVTVEHLQVPRQTATHVTGLLAMGCEHSVVITAEMPVPDREAVILMCTCKHFQQVHNELYTPIRKQQLLEALWTVFKNIIVRDMFAMQECMTCVFVLQFTNETERISVCVEHQRMQAAHGLTGAPVLDASGAVAWPGRVLQTGLRWTEGGGLELLPQNRSLPGEPDSRIGLVLDWLTAKYEAFRLAREEVSVLEHP
jgi:hypothetical protein